MVQHAALLDPEIHEPKGVATASAGTAYTSNGVGSGVWSTIFKSVSTLNAIGGDQGADTINVKKIFKDGVDYGPTLLNTLTASNSVSLSDTTSFTTAYRYYEIVFENIVPVNNAVTLALQLYSGGVLQTTNYDSLAWITNTASNGAAIYTSNSINISASIAQSNFAGRGLSLRLNLYRLTSATEAKAWRGEGIAYDTSTGHAAILMTTGYWFSNAAVTGINFTASSGNISTGTVKIYGMN